MLVYGIIRIIVLYYVIKKLVLEYGYPTLRTVKYIVESCILSFFMIIINNWYNNHYQLIYIIINK